MICYLCVSHLAFDFHSLRFTPACGALCLASSGHIVLLFEIWDLLLFSPIIVCCFCWAIRGIPGFLVWLSRVFWSYPVHFPCLNPSLHLLQLFARIGAMCVPFVLYVIVWLSVDPPTLHIENDDTKQDVAHAVCKSEYSFWDLLILGGDAVLLLSGVFMAYMVSIKHRIVLCCFFCWLFSFTNPSKFSPRRLPHMFISSILSYHTICVSLTVVWSYP